jgi:hypothetical protein
MRDPDGYLIEGIYTFDHGTSAHPVRAYNMDYFFVGTG